MKKKEILKTIITIIVSVVLSSGISVYATSTYLYDSCDVSYDNTSSGLNATNVQSSLDELYMHATDYTSMDTRVNALESRWVDYNNMLEIKGNSSGTGDVGIKIYDKNNKSRSGFNYNETAGSTVLASYDSTGTWGNFGDLRIFGDNIYIGNNEKNASVKINGTDISTKYSTNITPLVGSGSINLYCYMGVCILKVNNFNPGNITSRTTIGTLPSGYRPVTEMTEQMSSCVMGATTSGNIWMDPTCANQVRYQNITYTQWY